MGALTIVITASVQRMSGWLSWLFHRCGIFGTTNDISQTGLHVGSGPTSVEGWVNVDYSIHVLVSRIPLLPRLLFFFRALSEAGYENYRSGGWDRVQFWDLRYPLPFQSNIFDYVYSSHVFEHLSRHESAVFLRESHRILKPGGTCRIVVPDMQLAADQYLSAVNQYQNDRSGNKQVSFLGKSMTIAEVSSAFPAEFYETGRIRHFVFGHAWMYDFWSLKAALEEAGFEEVRRFRYRNGTIPDLEVLDRRPDNSLHVECRKPDTSRQKEG